MDRGQGHEEQNCTFQSGTKETFPQVLAVVPCWSPSSGGFLSPECLGCLTIQAVYVALSTRVLGLAAGVPCVGHKLVIGM